MDLYIYLRLTLLLHQHKHSHLLTTFANSFFKKKTKKLIHINDIID